MKKIFGFVLFGILLVTLAACTPGSKTDLGKPDTEMQLTAPGPNPELGKPVKEGKVAGLFTGLLHGLISPVTLIISFSNPAVQMYEVHNDGSMYNLGFLIGAIVLFAVLGFSGGRRR